MEATRRDALYLDLPAVASPGDLYDCDVILHASGRFLTVGQAWHGPSGVERLNCLPGAHPFLMVGNAFGTSLPDVVLAPDDPPCLLLGALTPTCPLRLRKAGATADQEDAVRAMFPGYGAYAVGETVAPQDVVPGNVLVLDDGRAHRVTAGEELVPMDLATREPVADAASQPLARYLLTRDQQSLPLTRLR